MCHGGEESRVMDMGALAEHLHTTQHIMRRKFRECATHACQHTMTCQRSLTHTHDVVILPSIRTTCARDVWRDRCHRIDVMCGCDVAGTCVCELCTIEIFTYTTRQATTHHSSCITHDTAYIKRHTTPNTHHTSHHVITRQQHKHTRI